MKPSSHMLIAGIVLMFGAICFSYQLVIFYWGVAFVIVSTFMIIYQTFKDDEIFQITEEPQTTGVLWQEDQNSTQEVGNVS